MPMTPRKEEKRKERNTRRKRSANVETRNGSIAPLPRRTASETS